MKEMIILFNKLKDLCSYSDNSKRFSYQILGWHDATSVNKFKEFITNCRKQLKSEKNLFWVALQSNSLADLSNVGNDFKEALTEMKDDHLI